VEYSHKLNQLNQILATSTEELASRNAVPQYTRIGRGRALLSGWLAEKKRQDTLALTRSLTDHDAAMEIDAPRGLLLHGAVGTGKSMLVDLFSECLPNKRKRRYHYSTFMLNVLSRLEALRRQRLADVTPNGERQDDAHTLLWLARELVTTSPILFLDEFQLPDRMAAKTLSGLLTCFFRLGGVLIATSNRLPDELAKAAGIEYSFPTRYSMGSGFLGGFARQGKGKSERMFAGLGEYAGFLELLKTRCEVWDMEGMNDYRRGGATVPADENMSDISIHLGGVASSDNVKEENYKESGKTRLPRYFITPHLETDGIVVNGVATDEDLVARIPATVFPNTSSISWTPSSAIVYGRTIPIPRTHDGISAWTFDEICATSLGPADYITLASTYHTFIITSIPILTASLKNEARRFITLLDALYEARCKLAISAAASPDDLFFPDLRASKDGNDPNGQKSDAADDMQAETFSEIHQDLTVPFRPNISSYKETSTPYEEEYEYRADALEDDPPNKMRRAALGEDVSEHQRMESLGQWRVRVDFGRSSAFVGEDETFAWKRATSRLWEMCGDAWWTREGLWRPLGSDMRHWEGRRGGIEQAKSIANIVEVPETSEEGVGRVRDVSKEDDELLFRQGASPFRTHEDPPPRIQPEHVWGVAQWGKRAGAWGKGVEGLKDRTKDK
jgi:protein AFG1